MLQRASWLLISLAASGTFALAAPPPHMLWSWFVNDDLRPIKDPQLGVAWLALSLEFKGSDAVLPVTRKQSLRLPPGMFEMPVVRFDFGYPAPQWTGRQRAETLRLIAALMRVTKGKALQLDFDAPVSAYPFYTKLLTELRAKLGPETFLSITALVSWCASPNSWLKALPVNEFVPMLFDMGSNAQPDPNFAFAGCRTSVGVDAAKPLENPLPTRRRYVFNKEGRPWSSAETGELFP